MINDKYPLNILWNLPQKVPTFAKKKNLFRVYAHLPFFTLNILQNKSEMKEMRNNVKIIHVLKGAAVFKIY